MQPCDQALRPSGHARIPFDRELHARGSDLHLRECLLRHADDGELCATQRPLRCAPGRMPFFRRLRTGLVVQLHLPHVACDGPMRRGYRHGGGVQTGDGGSAKLRRRRSLRPVPRRRRSIRVLHAVTATLDAVPVPHGGRRRFPGAVFGELTLRKRQGEPAPRHGAWAVLEGRRGRHLVDGQKVSRGKTDGANGGSLELSVPRSAGRSIVHATATLAPAATTTPTAAQKYHRS